MKKMRMVLLVLLAASSAMAEGKRVSYAINGKSYEV